LNAITALPCPPTGTITVSRKTVGLERNCYPRALVILPELLGSRAALRVFFSVACRLPATPVVNNGSARDQRLEYGPLPCRPRHRCKTSSEWRAPRGFCRSWLRRPPRFLPGSALRKPLRRSLG
jgi:hypothetical protein